MSIAPNAKTVDLSADAQIGPLVDGESRSTISAIAHVNFSWASAAWLTMLALPLIAFPRILALIFSSLLTETGDAEGTPEAIRQLNVLERSLASLAGVACLTLAAMLVVQTGALPLTSSLSASHSIHTASAQAPFRAPTIMITLAFFSALAWYTYDLGMWVATGPSAALAVWGLWALLFAHEGRVNKVGGPNNKPEESYLKEQMQKKDL